MPRVDVSLAGSLHVGSLSRSCCTPSSAHFHDAGHCSVVLSVVILVLHAFAIDGEDASMSAVSMSVICSQESCGISRASSPRPDQVLTVQLDNVIERMELRIESHETFL
jgi:hypothetical protein